MEPKGEHQLQLPEQPQTAESEPAIEIIGLKEALRMLRETDTGDSAILDILQDVINQPVPKTDDPEIDAEYRKRMEVALEMALSIMDKSDRTLEIKRQIQERIDQLENPS